MARHVPLLMVMLLVAGTTTGLKAEQTPPRLKRADSFLGIHFDFHAGKDCNEIGKNTTSEMVNSIIDQVHPDYLQIDCKGHPGFSSYPTKVGNPSPGFVGDPLRVWRQATAARGVALYMHYSGVWDSEAIALHPDWAAINADGTTNGNATSFFGPYVDQLLIPQLRELAGDYKVDGAWVDGECWASVPDYGEAARKAFRTRTGITDVPHKPGDPHWFEFLEFNRESFRQYLRHYITEVKKTNPNFQLCSNWAFTDHMPEPVSAPVDFLSGDYSPQDSVNSARLSARYLARQERPWDLMAWGFTTKPGRGGRNIKTAVQLEREAAMVLALGGGFEVYLGQKRDGSVYAERIPVMAEVAKFCRARQAICHHAVQVSQIAMLYSTAAHYGRIDGLFSRDPSPMSGTLQALLDGQQSVEVLGEAHLLGRMREYPLILVPEWEYLEPAFRQALASYTRSGGNLLLVGPKTAALFQPELGVTLENSPAQMKYLAHNASIVEIKGPSRSADLGPKAKVFGKLQSSKNANSDSIPAGSIAQFGKGKIAATYFEFSRDYLERHNEDTRQYLLELVHELFPEPMVEITGSPDVEVVVNRIHGKLAINLINTSGPHREEPIIDSIAPVGPLAVTIRRSSRPSKVTLEPSGEQLAFQYQSGAIRVTVPSVAIHDILVVE